MAEELAEDKDGEHPWPGNSAGDMPGGIDDEAPAFHGCVHTTGRTMVEAGQRP